ncbi:MAG: FAD-binding oxidoreductase [Acidimicrobiia bacterium]|nr:MAG: FAD-binding oxidoreductase [Acidimicrobiia bacterium]
MPVPDRGVNLVDASVLTHVLSGRLLESDDPVFDVARSLWNTRFDRRPDLIVRCKSDGDVKASIDYAREHGLELSVKGGGHSYAANSVADSGLLVDLSPMKAIRVDAEARTVTVEGGVTCAEMDAATQLHGLATPTPTVSSVGVIGAALGGGAGYLSRKYGLMIDNVISAQVVTADGRQLRAASDENADLFWALRGGGGNFGVVTSLELRLHKVGPQVLSGQIVYPFDNAGDKLRFFRDFMAEAPDEFQCYPFCFRIPPIDVFPEEFHGQPALDFVLYHEDPDAADFVLPLRELGEPILEEARLGRYVDAQTGFDANLPKGQRYISKAHDLNGLSDGAIDTMVEFVPRMVGPLSAAYFDPLGGAIGRVDPSATPYGGRTTTYGFHIIAGWMDTDEDEPVLAWASEFHGAMRAHATGGVYVSLIADDEPDRIPAAYGANYPRLVALKRRWDPTNLFRSNYNIPPG